VSINLPASTVLPQGKKMKIRGEKRRILARINTKELVFSPFVLFVPKRLLFPTELSEKEL